MKRKRGHSTGHKAEKRGKTEHELPSLSSSESESEPEFEPETDEVETKPPPEPEPEPEIKVNPKPKPEPAKPPVGQVVYSRVRVKIKSPASVPIEPRPTSSEKSNEQQKIPVEREQQKPSLEREQQKPPLERKQPKPSLEREDGGFSDLKTPKFNTFSRKFGGIKIKTNKNLALPSASANASVSASAGAIASGSAIASASASESEGKESNLPGGSAGGSEKKRNEAQLKSALAVIRKIMRMEAAAPFNEPVDPIALGIPDYFDVIDTPMDFSTICKEIEWGNKYMNSDDVYRDIQLIWHNCYKYNNKGDYVIDLMRRVKKNLSKYWGGAGLSVCKVNYNAEQGGQSGQEKALYKSKLKNKKKRRSTMDHKNDCMCAVCTIRRRKFEKDNPLANDSATVNLEERSASGASSMDHSPGLDHTEHNSRRNDTPLKKGADNQLSNDNINNSNSNNIKFRNNQTPKQVRSSENDESDESGNSSDEELEYKEKDVNGDNNASSQPKETYDKIQPTKEKEVLIENYAVLELCKSLFNNRPLFRRTSLSARQSVPVQDNPIRSAVASLLKR